MFKTYFNYRYIVIDLTTGHIITASNIYLQAKMFEKNLQAQEYMYVFKDLRKSIYTTIDTFGCIED